MAFATMTERLYEVAAAIHRCALGRIGLVRPGREEEPFPYGNEKSPAKEKAELMRTARLRTRLERAQVCPQVAEIAVGDARERGIRKRGKVVSAIGTPPFAHRAHEVGGRPAADTGLRIGCDVRTVERTEGRLQRAPAGIRHR